MHTIPFYSLSSFSFPCRWDDVTPFQQIYIITLSEIIFPSLNDFARNERHNEIEKKAVIIIPYVIACVSALQRTKYKILTIRRTEKKKKLQSHVILQHNRRHYKGINFFCWWMWASPILTFVKNCTLSFIWFFGVWINFDGNRNFQRESHNSVWLFLTWRRWPKLRLFRYSLNRCCDAI